MPKYLAVIEFHFLFSWPQKEAGQKAIFFIKFILSSSINLCRKEKLFFTTYYAKGVKSPKENLV